MVKEIEQAILGHLDGLVIRFKALAVKVIGLMVTCWILIGTLWIGLALPVTWVSAKIFQGNQPKLTITKEVLRNQINRERMNAGHSRMSYQSPVSAMKSTAPPLVKSEISNAAGTLNELRRFERGLESLVSR
jgi:hypothetical protein